MQVVVNLQGFPMKLLLLITDVTDALAHNPFDIAHHFGQFYGVGQAHLAANNNALGRCKGFAGNARVRFNCDERIKHCIRNPVTDLIGVTFRDRLGGENIVIA